MKSGLAELMTGKAVWATFGVVVAVAVVATSVWFIVRPGKDTPTYVVCGLARPRGVEPQTSAATSEVEVVEQGWSAIQHHEFSTVSIGVVLRNTSDRVAYRTRVAFDAFDSAGVSIVDGVQAEFKVI